MKSTILLYQHTGSSNHGCEALIRTVSDMLSGSRLLLHSADPAADEKYEADSLFDRVYTAKRYAKTSCTSLLRQLEKRTPLRFPTAWTMDHSMEDIPEKIDAAVAVGGDVYCYYQGHDQWSTDRWLKEQGTKLILWGCSLEPKDIQGQLANHLSVFDLIAARESITYSALMNQPQLAGKTILCPDPAFFLKPEPCRLPEQFDYGNMIGLNVSPLVQKREAVQGILVKNCIRLMEEILAHTQYGIALIPHVTENLNDDREILRKLYEPFRSNSRVCMIDDMDCRKLKYAVGGCRRLVAARTHASIAGYSQRIPTLVIGYSVKSRGLAQDIFGRTDPYVIPIERIVETDSLLRAYQAVEKLCETSETQLENYMKKMADRKDASEKKLNQVIKGCVSI